jgi:signal transduction histidine kinase
MQPVVDRVATALDSPIELRDTLTTLAALARELVGATRCTIFLVEGAQLHAAVSVSETPDPELAAALRSMPPIDIEPDAWDLLGRGQPVVIDDARTNPLVPPGWADLFDVSSVALLPCLSPQPCGLLAAERDRDQPFTDAELAAFQRVASSVADAVASARPFDVVARRARLAEALTRAAHALAAPLTHEDIARRLVDAYTDLLGARMCAIGLVDDAQVRMTTVVSRNTLPVEPVELTEIPEHIVRTLGEMWADRKQPMRLGDDPWLDGLLGSRRVGVRWYLVVPLLNHGHTLGAVVIGFGEKTTLAPEEVAAAEALAAFAGAAFERYGLLTDLDRQLRRLDALYHASSALTEGTATARALITRLNRLLADHGFEVVSLAFRARGIARHIGGDEPTPEERKTWVGAKATSLALGDGTLAVPMRTGRKLVGTLRVRPVTVEPDQRAFLEALAAGLAEVASRSALRAEVEEAARERAVTAERDRLAADLHDSAGQLFVALGLLARRLADSLPDDTSVDKVRRLADLADQGRTEIANALRALTFVPAGPRGLADSVQALARSVAGDSGLTIDVEITGRSPRLPSEQQQALFRVAHEALTNAWRHSGGDRVCVQLIFDRAGTLLRVTDNGRGLHNAATEGLHLGIAGMRRAMENVGGTLTVDNGNGNELGVVVEARLAIDAS